MKSGSRKNLWEIKRKIPAVKKIPEVKMLRISPPHPAAIQIRRRRISPLLVDRIKERTRHRTRKVLGT